MRRINPAQHPAGAEKPTGQPEVDGRPGGSDGHFGAARDPHVFYPGHAAEQPDGPVDDPHAQPLRREGVAELVEDHEDQSGSQHERRKETPGGPRPEDQVGAAESPRTTESPWIRTATPKAEPIGKDQNRNLDTMSVGSVHAASAAVRHDRASSRGLGVRDVPTGPQAQFQTRGVSLVRNSKGAVST
ncbi:MAG: hypothetical protein JXQ29_06170 [Planctomycetes bacterium]|nr:hypothetical protein [Planctomycetota bacterium]